MRLDGARMNDRQFGRMIKAIGLTVNAGVIAGTVRKDVSKEEFLQSIVGGESFALTSSGPRLGKVVFHDTNITTLTLCYFGKKGKVAHYANHEAFEIVKAIDREFCSFCRGQDRFKSSFGGHTVCRKCVASNDPSLVMAIKSLTKEESQ